MEDLKSQLEAVTAKLIAARRKLAERHENTILQKHCLFDEEAALIMIGIPGKNKEERDAYVVVKMAARTGSLRDCEKCERRAELELTVLRDCRRQLENIALIESGEA
jgi:hypothetical protein